MKLRCVILAIKTTRYTEKRNDVGAFNLFSATHEYQGNLQRLDPLLLGNICPFRRIEIPNVITLQFHHLNNTALMTKHLAHQPVEIMFALTKYSASNISFITCMCVTVSCEHHMHILLFIF
jgi:hypothetical protein